MAVRSRDLWSLTRGNPSVDPEALAAAVRVEIGKGPLDYRTRLLVRDSMQALRDFWGEDRLREWLTDLPERPAIERILAEEFERPGFPSLRNRLMTRTDPEDIRQYLRELGSQVRRPIPLTVGGSAALMLGGVLERATE